MAEKKDEGKKADAGLKSGRGEVKTEDQIAPLVASPTGPVPASAVVGTKEEAEELKEKRREQIEEERKHPSVADELTEEQLEAMPSAELRTVARQRGYESHGRRVNVQDFLRQQSEDSRFGGSKGKK